MNKQLLKQVILDESMPIEIKEMALNLLLNEHPKNCSCSKDCTCSTYCEVDSYGNKFWKNENGEFHRINGPAAENADGTKYWYLNGRCHRIDGPAIEYADGTKYWYLNGRFMQTEKEFKELLASSR